MATDQTKYLFPQTAVAPGSYSSADGSLTITVDNKGRIVSVVGAGPETPANATSLQGTGISASPPSLGQVLVYDSSLGEYVPMYLMDTPANPGALIKVSEDSTTLLLQSLVSVNDDGNVFAGTEDAEPMTARLNIRPGAYDQTGRIVRATTTYADSNQPDVIAGLTLWYKADSILDTNDGDPIDSVFDYGFAGKDLYSSGTNRPTYRAADAELNYQPVIEFDGANNTFLDSNAFLFSDVFDTNQFCFYFVQKTASSADNNSTIGTELPDGDRVNFHLGWSDGSIYCDYGNPGSGGRLSASKPPGFDGAWHILKGVREPNDNFNLYMDGVSVLSGTYTDTLDTNQTDTLIVGNFNGSSGSTERIAEIIWFRSVPTIEEQDAVTNYLAQKYALAGTDDTPQSADLDQFQDNDGTVIGRTGPKAELVYPSLSLTGDLTLTPFSSDQNNLNPAAYDSATGVMRLSASSPVKITGLAGGADGRILIVHNVGGEKITFTDEDSNSDPENRFALGSNFDLKEGKGIVWIWDEVSERWRLVAASPSASGWNGITQAQAAARISRRH